MAQYYKLQPGIGSISIDGVEHICDPETGILTVEMLTPNLAAEMAARGAVAVEGPGGEPKAAKAKAEPASARHGRAGHADTPGNHARGGSSQ